MAQVGTTVSEGETPADECEYCGLPFPTTERLVLHRGVEHPQRLDAAEREEFEAAVSDEEDSLRKLRLKALAMLIFLYFGFLILYAVYA